MLDTGVWRVGDGQDAIASSRLAKGHVGILLGPLFFSCMQGIKNQRLTGAEIDFGEQEY